MSRARREKRLSRSRSLAFTIRLDCSKPSIFSFYLIVQHADRTGCQRKTEDLILLARFARLLFSLTCVNREAVNTEGPYNQGVFLCSKYKEMYGDIEES